jgi:hypothetical protein
MLTARPRIEEIRSRYVHLAPVMDERVTRLWAAAEAQSLPRGGIAAVAVATGISVTRIRCGIRDLAVCRQRSRQERPQDQRVRRPGAGRKRLTDKDPGLVPALEALFESRTRDPEAPLRWTCKSRLTLADELRALGRPLGGERVGEILRELGYTLHGTRGTSVARAELEAQFEHINRQAKAFLRAGEPIVSVTTTETATRGIDAGRSAAARRVGGSALAESLSQWWSQVGRRAYPRATRLLVVADTRRSTSLEGGWWKACLRGFSEKSGLHVTLAESPPGTSKWNEVEHRLHCRPSSDPHDASAERFETVVSLIGGGAGQRSLSATAECSA